MEEEEQEFRKGESGDFLASSMQMTWFRMASQRKTKEQWWNVLLRCVEVSGGKSKVMMLNEEEGFKCEVCVDGMQ